MPLPLPPAPTPGGSLDRLRPGVDTSGAGRGILLPGVPRRPRRLANGVVARGRARRRHPRRLPGTPRTGRSAWVSTSTPAGWCSTPWPCGMSSRAASMASTRCPRWRPVRTEPAVLRHHAAALRRWSTGLVTHTLDGPANRRLYRRLAPIVAAGGGLLIRPSFGGSTPPHACSPRRCSWRAEEATPTARRITEPG